MNALRRAHFTKHNGMGGESIYGSRFEDEVSAALIFHLAAFRCRYATAAWCFSPASELR